MTNENLCPTHGATMAPRDPSKMSAEQLWCGEWFDCAHCGTSILVPSAALKEQNRILALPVLCGYHVEKVSDEPGKAGYLLHGARVTFTLIRYHEHHRRLYVLNSKGHRTSIKGHYTFTDETGKLEVSA